MVKELANMICGDALSTLEQSALVLSPPQVVAPADFVCPRGACRRSFYLGNGWLTVILHLQDADD